MFKKPSEQELKTLIGTNIHIEGSLSFSGGMRVDGNVKGDITADPIENSFLILSTKAHVEGNIHAAHIISDGTIAGNIVSDQRLELQEHARVEGDINYLSMEIHQGAIVNGALHSINTTLHQKTENPTFNDDAVE